MQLREKARMPRSMFGMSRSDRQRVPSAEFRTPAIRNVRDRRPVMNARIESLAAHTWPVAEWAIARLSVRLDRLDARHGMAIYDCVEDGLGPCSGCAFRLPSGVAVLLQELEHVISHFKAKGPDVYADAGDIEALGRDWILAEMLEALGLGEADVDLKCEAPGPGDVSHMKEVVARIRRERATRDEPEPSRPLTDEDCETRRRKAHDALAAVQQHLDREAADRAAKLIEDQDFQSICGAVEARGVRLTGAELLKLAWFADALRLPLAIRRPAQP